MANSVNSRHAIEPVRRQRADEGLDAVNCARVLELVEGQRGGDRPARAAGENAQQAGDPVAADGAEQEAGKTEAGKQRPPGPRC